MARVLGDQLQSVILTGSQARDQARSDSDIHLRVVVRDDSDDGDLIRRTSAAVSALLLQHDVVISRACVFRERFEREQTPFCSTSAVRSPHMKAGAAGLLAR